MIAEPSRLARRLGLFDAVVVGLGAAIGAELVVGFLVTALVVAGRAGRR